MTDFQIHDSSENMHDEDVKTVTVNGRFKRRKWSYHFIINTTSDLHLQESTT